MFLAIRFGLLYLVVTQVLCGDDQYGFITRELVTQCIPNPIYNVCPLVDKVPKRVYNIYPGISRNVQSITGRFRSAGGNANCTLAVQMYQCSRSIATCKSELSYFYWDSARSYRMCLAARRACTDVRDIKLAETWLDCSKVANEDSKNQSRRQATCKEYPKLERDACPIKKYKVANVNVLKSSFIGQQRSLRRLLKEQNVADECSKSVFTAFCEYRTPVCTRDEQYEVTFISRQKCLKMLRCLKTTTDTTLFYRINGLYVPCQALPDEKTGKNISLANIFKATTSTFNATTSTFNATISSMNRTNAGNVEMKAVCCSGEKLSTMGYIFVYFISCLFVNSFA